MKLRRSRRVAIDYVQEGIMPIVRVERRLAAIMATDIVGYSRPIETDEARTLTLRLRPDFSTAEYMRKSVLLEHT